MNDQFRNYLRIVIDHYLQQQALSGGACQGSDRMTPTLDTNPKVNMSDLTRTQPQGDAVIQYRDDNMSFTSSQYSVRIHITKGDKRANILEAMADKFRRSCENEQKARQLAQEYLTLAATVEISDELPFRSYGYVLILHETTGVIDTWVILPSLRPSSNPAVLVIAIEDIMDAWSNTRSDLGDVIRKAWNLAHP